MEKPLPSIFDFTSYRTWLRDYCEAKRRNDSSFSYRSLAKEAGFASPNYLQLVIAGRRNLGEKSIKAIAKALRLGKMASRYFKVLVDFEQADTNAKKNEYLARIMRCKDRSAVTKIIADQFSYYNEWYHCVMRELAAGLPADAIDYAGLAKRFYPAIMPKQAKKSIRLLLKLELLHVDEHGRLAQSSPCIATDRETQSVAIRNFHGRMLGLARDSLETISPENREISSLTMRISKTGFEKIKKRIQDFKEELMRIIGEDENVDRVYHANFQFFPVSRLDDKEQKCLQ